MTHDSKGTYRVERQPGGLHDQLAPSHDYPLPASGYRLQQAEILLQEMGYVRQDDGAWRLPAEKLCCTT